MKPVVNMLKREPFKGGAAGWSWRILLGWFTAWSVVGLFVVGFNIRVPGGSIPDMLFMFLAAALVFLESARLYGWGRATAAFAWVAGVSGAVESIGAKTGFPFGAYVYTDAFGFRLFGLLPVTIPLAWWIVVQPLFLMARRRHRGGAWSGAVLVPFFVGTAAVWVDFLLEPVAWIRRSYWLWMEPGRYYGVPGQNFIGWFGTAFVIALGLWVLAGTRPLRAGWPAWGPYCQGVLAVVVLTFWITAVVAGFTLAAIIGLAFLGFLTGSTLPFVRKRAGEAG